MPMPEDLPESMINLMAAFSEIGWLLPLIGFIEIIGGFLIIPKKTRALGAIIILPIMVGILLTHIVNEPSGLILAVILFVINIWVIIENREKYYSLID